MPEFHIGGRSISSLGARRNGFGYFCMSDATDYLMAHAKKTILDARRLPAGSLKFRLRHIGSVYHLLAKQGAYSNIAFLDDYRTAKNAEDKLRSRPQFFLV